MENNALIKNTRKTISLILTLCMVFALCVTSISAGATGETETKKMLHITGVKDDSVMVSIDKELTQNATYKVYFKYKIVTGRLDSVNGNTIKFVDYQGWRRRGTHVVAGSDNGEAFTTLTDGTAEYNDMELTFTANVGGAHKLGFQLSGNSEFYIADFKAEDSEGNVLVDGVDGFQKLTGSPTVVTEQYNDDYFLTAKNNKMIHIAGGSGVKIGVRAYDFPINDYTVYFKYKFVKGRLGGGNGYTVKFSDYNGDSDRQHSTGVPADSGMYEAFTTMTDGTEAYNDMLLSFTSKNKARHDLVFDLTGDSDFYIADFTVKDSKGNVLVSDVNAIGIITGTLTTQEVLPYDDDYFLTAENNKMIHIAGNSGKIGIKFYDFPINDYKVYFKYKFVDGRLGDQGYTARFADYFAGQYRHYSTHVLAGTSEYESFKTLTGGSEEYNDMELSFTLRNKGTHDLVFELTGNSDFYIADFKVMDTKGNVFVSGVDAIRLITGSLTTQEILPYDDDYFLTAKNSEILHIASDENATGFGKADMQAIGTKVGLTKGKTYNVHFEYKVVKGIFDRAGYDTVRFADWISDFEYRHHSTHAKDGGEQFDPVNVTRNNGINEIDLSFVAKSTATHILGFAFGNIGELYISDFVLTDENGNVLREGFDTFTVNSSNAMPTNEKISYSEKAMKSVEFDFNNDGTVNGTDLGILQKYLLGTEKTASDINGDGKINILDLVRFKKLLVA